MVTFPRFRAPEMEAYEKRQVEIPFDGNVAALSYLTVVSGRIMYPFKVLQVKMFFDDEANNLVQHGWFIDTGVGVSTTGFPSGTNLFGRESPTAVFIGKGIIRIVNTSIKYTEAGLYIKFYTYNGNAYAYNLNGSIIIEEL